jgi:hypothetical protein
MVGAVVALTREARTGEVVQLDGSHSFATECGPLTCQGWLLSKPASSDQRYGKEPTARYPAINVDVVESEFERATEGYVANFDRIGWRWTVLARIGSLWMD